MECLGDEDHEAKKLCLVAFLPHIVDSMATGRSILIQVGGLSVANVQCST